MKTCSFCKEKKERREFWKKKESPDGITAQCKECYKKNYRGHVRKRPKRETVQAEYIYFHIDVRDEACERIKREYESGEWHRKARYI